MADTDADVDLVTAGAAGDSVRVTGTAELAEFMASLRFADIPAAVVEHMKLCLLDTLGCGLFGSTLPWTRIVADTVADLDPGHDAVEWGGSRRFGPHHAALVNGSAVHAFELDDLHAASIVHPGSVVAPAVVALASRRPDATGADLLTALVAGYETAARVGMTMGAAHLIAGWHPTGTHGAIGAAAGAGSMLRLDAEGMRNAIGTAGSMAAGLMSAQFESMVKRLHAGRAAQSGVYAALLAARGYVGIADLFEAEYGGYCSTFSPAWDAAPLTAGLGQEWATAAVGFKPYSCNGSCHPTVEMLREARAEGLRAEDVERVEVWASTATVKHVGWPYQPSTITTAQMNLPYIAAAVLTDGDAFVDQFTAERVSDPALVDLARRVVVHADPEIDARGDSARHATRLVLHLRDHSALERSRAHARGSAHDPMTTADVENKYLRLAAKAVSSAQAERIADAVDRLDRLGDLNEFCELLAGETEASS